jgi:hypothetical protein
VSSDLRRSDEDPRLFFFAAGGAGAVDLLETFAGRPWPAASLKPFGSALRELSDADEFEVRVWGFPDSPSTRRDWSGLHRGDVGLGYAAGRFRVLSRLIGVTYSPELARQLFGGVAYPSLPLIAFFDEAARQDIPRRTVTHALGYGEGFTPRRGLFIPSAERQRFIRSEYGTPEDFVSIAAADALTALYPRPEPREEPRPSPPRSMGTDGLKHQDAFQSRPPTIIEGLAERLEEVQALPPGPYARLETPDVVTIDDPFTLMVGLSPQPDQSLGGLSEPQAIGDADSVDVQVVADGFVLESGSWRNRLALQSSPAYPVTSLSLRATHELVGPGFGLVQALYAVGGKTIGAAARVIGIREPGKPDPPPPPPQFSAAPVAAGGDPAPDLTVRITLSAVSDSRLQWSFSSPWPVELPNEPATSSIGSHPDDFAREVLRGVPDHEYEPDLAFFLQGVGSTIADVMPHEFWSILRAVQQAVGTERRATVLMLSEEPHVPWELALVRPPLLRTGPPFLAAQIALGRWVLQPNSHSVYPPVAAGQRPFGVVVGRYKGTGALPAAVSEAAELMARYDAEEIKARLHDLVACLGGQPPSRILHFALHGAYAPGTGKDGLYLEDGRYLAPLSIRGTSLTHVPLVFLNACEVGTGQQKLGAYAGTAEAFVSAGATAVIAPLWAIRDAQAREVALEFYERIFEGQPAAEALAEVRGEFGDGPAVATQLAYQFFGHPRLRFNED